MHVPMLFAAKLVQTEVSSSLCHSNLRWSRTAFLHIFGLFENQTRRKLQNVYN